MHLFFYISTLYFYKKACICIIIQTIINGLVIVICTLRNKEMQAAIRYHDHEVNSNIFQLHYRQITNYNLYDMLCRYILPKGISSRNLKQVIDN